MNAPLPYPPSADEIIAATAAAWLADRDAGPDAEREAEFARWRAADLRHEAAVARLEQSWAALAALRDFRPEAVRHPERDLLAARPPVRRSVRRRSRLAAAVALAAGLVLAAGWWFGVPLVRGDAEQRYATAAEGYQRVALDDGSMVELNSASEVGVRFSPAERRVRLVRGEAHFTVAKNKARPFVVEAGGVAVRAVGTAFNIRLGPRDVEVLVTEGRVAVAQAERVGSVASTVVPVLPEVGVNQRLVVPLRQAAPVAPTAVVPVPPVVEPVAPAAVREALAWQSPRLVFSDTPLADAIAQFNRRNSVQLELADPALGTLPIGGSFRAENVEAFVRLLASGGDLVADRPEAARIVLRRTK